MLIKWPLLILLLISMTTFSQEKFLHTRFLTDSTAVATANIESLVWLQGHWRGNALGGIVEEVWTPPLGGSMMGAFKLVVDDQVVFYELMDIIEENNSLLLRIKHFDNHLRGWEEKDKSINFRLIAITANVAWFDGFTMERVSDDEINIYVVINRNGNKVETKFNYHRHPGREE
jgi:hypothetical protein